MALNIFVFLFFGLLTGLLVHFPLRRATTQVALKPLIPFFAVIGVVFLGNGFFAFLAARGLWMARTMPSVTSMGAFGDAEDGADVIVPGCTSLAGMSGRIRDALAEQGLHVTVLDPPQVAVKLAEMLVSLGQSHSPLAFPAPKEIEIHWPVAAGFLA